MTKKDDQRIVHRGERAEPENRQPSEAHEDEVRAEALPQSPEDLEALLRQEALANALPQPPAIPGWHQVWLSTTNTYTPIQQYTRLGYVPVKPEEHKQWAYLKTHSAQHGGDVVTCNEMVLYKIPEDAYQQIMRIVHHDRPNEEEDKLRANVEQMKDNSEFRDSDGKSLVEEEGDGFADQARDDRRVRAPRFQ